MISPTSLQYPRLILYFTYFAFFGTSSSKTFFLGPDVSFNTFTIHMSPTSTMSRKKLKNALARFSIDCVVLCGRTSAYSYRVGVVLCQIYYFIILNV